MTQDSRRQADLYWRQIIQLKGAEAGMRLYRNRLAGRVRAVEIVKAVASSGAIAGWAAFRAYPFVWGCIIAAAQLLDALKDVFPFARLHIQAAGLTAALELLLIETPRTSGKRSISASCMARPSSSGAQG